MVAHLGLTAATTLLGVSTGMIVGDSLGAIPSKAAVPATSNSAVPKATADGTPVNGTPTARQSLFTSALIVLFAIAVLLLGSRALKDARIG